MRADLQVFVVAPTGRDAKLICDMLAPREVECVPCADVDELCERLQQGVGAIILTEEALNPAALEKISSALVEQPRWSDVAVLLLTSNGDRIQAALRASVQKYGMRSVILIERPVRLLTLLTTLESALQSRKRQYELRDYLEERDRNEERLRQTQKLESVGVLAGGIAHDFNNLLTGVLGNASLALDLLPPGSRVAGMLGEVMRASERAAHLTKQLLAYAGKGRFRIEPVDLSRQVREIGSLLQMSIPRTVQLRLDLDQDLPCVDADSSQMQQVIMNLVINGAEAVPENQTGTVAVTTGTQRIDRAYIDTNLPDTELMPGLYVTLEVHDTGVGMNDETLERIFDPFFTTKFTGRGLGLAAVTGIVRGHKGALRVYTAPGQGSTFKLLFPATGALEQQAPEQKADHAALAGNSCILVIDDEDVVRRTAKTALERFGYSVILASDGRQGLTEFHKAKGRVDLVLLDMTMPVMSGEETFRQLRLAQPDVKVILSSGFNEVEAIRRFTGKGLAGFVQKPYTSAKLAGTVAEVLNAREQIRDGRQDQAL